jgi:3-oxoacyl-[acyl-carrier-protein] synthase-1
MKAISPLFITEATATTALGRGRAALWHGLQQGRSGLTANDFGRADFSCWIGRVAGLEDAAMDLGFEAFDCRNNRLAQLALKQDGFLQSVQRLKQDIDAKRIGLFIGTSTSGILSTEEAFVRLRKTGALPEKYNYHGTQDLYSVVRFLRSYLGLRGPAFSVSTACSSSSKVFCDAHRFIQAGLCDAAIVGGVDSLCHTTLYGFKALELISAEACKPFDRARDGISIGEAAGFMILQKEPLDDNAVALLGYGESSDAYHISTPRPDGGGALKAMNDALKRAAASPEGIQYINLHGTATPSNDKAEAGSVAKLFGRRTACSSTKAWTGHTLGAAGITEAIIACETVRHQWLPKTLNCKDYEEQLGIDLLRQSRTQSVTRAMSNSFGFGGSNCSLVFGKPAC